MDISNRALGLLLVAAIVISIGGTVISLNKLDGFSTTGMATNPNGTVTLSINELMSIILDDNEIDFGTCTLPGGAGITVDSALDSSGVNNSECTGSAGFLAAGDFLRVRNNGNVDTNVTITSNITGTNFLGADSWIAYKGVNTSGNPGCVGTLVTTYTNITTTNKAAFCSNLQTHVTDHSADLTIRAYLAPTATDGGVMQLTFTAHAIA